VIFNKLFSCLYYSRFFILTFLSLLFKIFCPYIFRIFACMADCTLKLITCIIFIGNFYQIDIHLYLTILYFYTIYFLSFIYIFLVLADCLHLYYHSTTFHFLLSWHPSYLGNKATTIQGFLFYFLKYGIILKVTHR